MNLNFLTNPTQRVATGKRLPTAELETLVLYGNPAVRAKIFKKAAPNAHVLAANQNTYHVMEALCRVCDPSQLAELMFTIRRHVPALMQSRYGNVVIQELLKKVPSVVKNDIVESMLEQAYAAATGQFSHHVVQQLLLDPVAGERVYEALAPKLLTLATDEVGQFIVGSNLSSTLSSSAVPASSSAASTSTPTSTSPAPSFWSALSSAPVPLLKQLLTTLWKKNRHHALIPIIEAIDKIPQISGKLATLVSNFVMEVVINKSLGGAKKKVSDEKKERKKEEEDETDEEFISDRAAILCSIIAARSDWCAAATLALSKRELSAPAVSDSQEAAEEQAAASPKKPENSAASPKSKAAAKAGAASPSKKQQQHAKQGSSSSSSSSSPGTFPIFMDWSRKQHLSLIVEALCRHLQHVTSTAAGTTATTSAAATATEIIRDGFRNSGVSLNEMINNKHAAPIARELVSKHSPEVIFGPTAVADIVDSAASLCKQPCYSVFFQQIVRDGCVLASSADAEAPGGGGASPSKASPKRSNVKKAAANISGSGSSQGALDLSSAAQLIVENIKSVLAKAAQDAAASHLVQCILDCGSSWTSFTEKEATTPSHTGLAASVKAFIQAVYNFAAANDFARINDFFATTPIGSHIMQSLLRGVDDAQLVTLLEQFTKCRLRDRYTGIPALARSKYGCHIVVVLLRELSRRSRSAVSAGTADQMKEHLRTAMNSLKPHVHFLALAASTGRRVFAVMSEIGSEQLRTMMQDVISMKCEAYLKGDPFLEGTGDGGSKDANMTTAMNKRKQAHAAQRRSRSS